MIRRYFGIFTKGFYGEEERRLQRLFPEAPLDEIYISINKVFREETKRVVNKIIDQVMK
jgi:hypothetical protein